MASPGLRILLAIAVLGAPTAASGQATELRALWDEFEARETAESRFAVALDRLQPLLANHRSGGGSWVRHAVSRRQVLARMEPIREALPSVWPMVEGIVAESCECGWIRGD